MPYIKTKALIIGKMPYKEHDKTLKLLLEDGRRIEAKIRKARDTGTKWGAVTEPVALIEVEIYERAGRFTITGISIDKFYESKDYASMVAQDFVAEIIEKTTPYGFCEEEIFGIAVTTFDDLERFDKLTTCARFLLETLRVHGYNLNVSSCSGCGTGIESDCHFDLATGSTVCKNCLTAYSIRFPMTAVEAVKKLEENGASVTLHPQMSKGLIELMLRIVSARFDAKINTSLHLKAI
jgi:DNA repair protein RecO